MGTRRVDPQPPSDARPALARLAIESLGARGEGVATARRVYVPYALPGETVTADVDGERATLIGIVAPSPDRIAPICPHFTICGGCAVQALATPAYAAWKRGLLVDALARAGIAAEVGPLLDAHGAGRRRATFHARTEADGTTRVGFMRARSHEIAAIDACPILDPGLAGALDAARAIAVALAKHPPPSKTGGARQGPPPAQREGVHGVGEGDHAKRGGGGTGVSRLGADPKSEAVAAPSTAFGGPPPPLRGGGSAKSLDIVCMASESGLDIDLRGHGPLDEAARARLVAVALEHDLARLANHGTIVVETRKPVLRIGAARLAPPPGAFLQATAAGEQALAARVMAGLDGAGRIADLFAGIGTFALRLAAGAEVAAYDNEAPALTALARAARETPGLRPVATEARDLFRRPLMPEELKRFDALVVDPPRAGAEAQMRAIVASSVIRVASVACDVTSFARDAAILTSAGFTMESVEPIDQFRYSPHLEMLALFSRRPAKPRRRLLG